MVAREPRGPIPRFYESLWRRKSQEVPNSRVGREGNALPFIPPGSRILDVGCGGGRLLQMVRSPALAVGVEIARPPLIGARERGLRVLRVDLEEPYLPFRDRTFDRVACLDVIEHLFDPSPLLSEIRRILALGGLLILQTPNVRHYSQIFRIAVKGRGPKTSSDPEGIDGGHVHYFTATDVKELLRSAGFAAVETRGTDGVHLLPKFRSLGILALARRAP